MHQEGTLVKTVTLFIAGVAGLLLMQAPSVAKGPVDKIVVEGRGLPQPIEIRDDDALMEFNPWGRSFIDWDRGRATEPPAGGQTYTVSFYLDDRVIYVLEYAPEPAGGGGLIYIPGPEHPDYRLNIGTIMGASSSDRWNPEGRWQYATAEWAALMPSHSRVQPPATGDGGLR